jgi:anthranilate synthase/aminodeoxychorismate synthase-like glutamine amidotransferase
MLRDYIVQAGQECIILRNDEKTIDQIKELPFDSIVISPGPKSPVDAGITFAVIGECWQDKPILGICLGHQAIGEFFGASLVAADRPMHGKTSTITHTDHPVFKDIPQHIDIMRYHSLILDNISSSPLEVIAQTDTDAIMAVTHPDKKIVGLQFHPESVLTQHGLQMIRNWYNYIAR